MVFTRSSIRIISHLSKNGLDDVFVYPSFSNSLEREIIAGKHFRRSLMSLCHQIIQSPKTWKFGPSHKFSIPKTAYSYRNVDWIDIDDLVRYSALVFSLAPQIESSRIEKSENVVFSYRFKSIGKLIDRNYNYKAFREKSAEISSKTQFKVKINTDISNFYDRLNLHRLENTLAEIGCDGKIVSCLNELLSFWANRNSFGLPVGCDASRILAEAALIPIDRALQRKQINFVRYVDDYRIFAESFAQAHEHLNILIQELDKESLFINTSKTVFIDLDKSRLEPSEEVASQIFSPEDENKVVEENKFITIGYFSKIVKTYRYPGKEQITRYASEDLKKLKTKTLYALPSDVEDNIRYFVRCYIYSPNREICDLIEVIDRYIHSLTYIVDALTKEEGRFSSLEAQAISQAFCEMYTKYSRSPCNYPGGILPPQFASSGRSPLAEFGFR